MEDQGSLREQGDRVAGDVVLRGAETARDQHDVGARRGKAERFDDPLEVVADGLVMRDVHADRGQLFGHPLRVRVGDLPEQELGADGDDLRPHVIIRCRVVKKYSIPE